MQVLARMWGSKARGTDGWSLSELRRLSGAWIRRHSGFHNRREADGRWPAAICRSSVALIPKLGAATEAHLRLIGLLSYIYRVWMTVRKHGPHRGGNEGVAFLAFRIAASVELAQWRGRPTLVAVLDCSTCYERIEHRTLGEGQRHSGMPWQVLSLVMEVYGGSHLVSVHSEVGHPLRGHHGLIAGCSFEDRVLKAFLLAVARLHIRGQFRRFVDYITKRSEAATLGETAAAAL